MYIPQKEFAASQYHSFLWSPVFLLYTKLIALSPANKSDRRKLCLTQVGKNASLYLRWSVLYFFINLILAGGLSWSFLSDQIRRLFFDCSMYHFWYLVALIYAIPLICLLFSCKRIVLVGIICLGWLYRCIWFVYQWIPGGDLIPWTTSCFDAARNTLTCAVPMMLLGILCKQDHQKKTARQWFRLTLVCFAINIAELTGLYMFSPQKNHFEFLLSMPGLIYCLVNRLLNVRFRFQNRTVPVILRKSSVWIYCIHPMFITIYGWIHPSLGIRRFAIVMVCLLLSTVVYVFLQINRQLIRHRTRGD